MNLLLLISDDLSLHHYQGAQLTYIIGDSISSSTHI